MNRSLRILRAGPGLTVQDRGRPGYLVNGLSRGGAADRLALAEGAALLGQGRDCAALELSGGGEFEAAGGPVRIALTGAPCPADIDGAGAAWNASHLLQTGRKLTIGAPREGSYAYLHLGGGIAAKPVLGARSAHLAAGIGAPLQAGGELPLEADSGARTGLALDVEDRFSDGMLRIVESIQTGRFEKSERARLADTAFTRDPRSNRMGVRLSFDGPPFQAEGQRTILSETVVPGDIQIAGDGTPFILLYEHQTTGGYPRIGTIIPSDLPRAAQVRPGGAIRFGWIDRGEALAACAAAARHIEELPSRVRPLVRDPHGIADLLSYQLIDGVTDGGEES